MLLIKNGHIKPIIGQELENGCVLIDDAGKIASIGTDFDIPEGTQVIDAGVPVSIITDAPVIPLQFLPMCAGLAASEGLDLEEAWKAITINPATYLGIADRVGSLEVGKDGDAVIWTANPLTTIGAHAYATIVDGKVVYQEAW